MYTEVRVEKEVTPLYATPMRKARKSTVSAIIKYSIICDAKSLYKYSTCSGKRYKIYYVLTNYYVFHGIILNRFL